jgi:hypothetical protein
LSGKNYSKEALKQIFGEMNLASNNVELEMGLTQTTFDPDNTNDDNDDDSSVSGRGGVCTDLFEESLKQISKTNSALLLEDTLRDVEGAFRAIASLLRVVDKPERDTSCAAISSIVLRCGSRKEQEKTQGPN